MVKKYFLPDGRMIYADQGLGQNYMTMVSKPNGSGRKRYISKELPVRATLQAAVNDLEQYSAKHGLRAI